jgi:pSer/pThr/pTyr-binding forkhead associated (FHA) protein
MFEPDANHRAGDGGTTESPIPTPSDLKAIIEAERTGLPFVHWLVADGRQRLLMLGSERERLTVGRRPDADVALVWDTEVSRAHALLEVVGGQWMIVDDGLSRNGTFVNGSRVHGRHLLHDRDRLCFGQTQVVFREPPDPEHGVSTAQAPSNAGAVMVSETQRKVLIALCRPVNDSTAATPATNRQIADEVFLSVDAVKAHLRVLFDRFGLGELPQNEKRARLAAQALLDGVLKRHDF